MVFFKGLHKNPGIFKMIFFVKTINFLKCFHEIDWVFARVFLKTLGFLQEFLRETRLVSTVVFTKTRVSTRIFIKP